MNVRILVSLLLLAGLAAPAAAHADDAELRQYVIERTIPGASELSMDEIKAISKKSNEVLEALGPDIQWVQSYVAEDKFYCVYRAPNKELIAKHAAMGGFPADRISLVSRVIHPSGSE